MPPPELFGVEQKQDLLNSFVELFFVCAFLKRFNRELVVKNVVSHSEDYSMSDRLAFNRKSDVIVSEGLTELCA